VVDEFEQIRTAMNHAANGKGRDPAVTMMLDNQRVICATLAMLCRGGQPPIEMARDLQDRAKKITKILEG
jgi:hypothetical protein